MGYEKKDEAKNQKLEELSFESFEKSFRHESSQNDLDSARAYNSKYIRSGELNNPDAKCNEEFRAAATEFMNGCSDELPDLNTSCPTPPDQVKMKPDPIRVPVIHPSTIIDAENKLQILYKQLHPGADRDEHRIKEIIMQLTRKGIHIINERPEGMNMSDYKRVRKELARLKNTYTSGKIIHRSKSVDYQRDAKGKVIKTESEGTTYHKKK